MRAAAVPPTKKNKVMQTRYSTAMRLWSVVVSQLTQAEILAQIAGADLPPIDCRAAHGATLRCSDLMYATSFSRSASLMTPSKDGITG